MQDVRQTKRRSSPKPPTFSISERDPFKNIDEEEERLTEFLSLFRFGDDRIWRKDRRGHVYLNIPIAFDIETSSWKEGDDYRACEYCFVLGFYDHVFFGRGWDDFIRLLSIIKKTVDVQSDKRIIIYVHNLGYEFQFIRKRFKWDSVFAVDERTPVKALTTDGIEFRCSYILSNYSLKKTGESLTKYHVEKMTGDLDYRLIRHERTYISPKEWKYVEHDGLVVLAYIEENIESNGNNILRIPLTNTGRVRRYVRKMCYMDRNGKRSSNAYRHYRNLMSALTIDGVEEYTMLKEGFQGGFTHARALMSDRIHENVTSYDFTSSYPYSMISEYYPMSKGEKVFVNTKEEFENYIRNYCCLFTIRIKGLLYNGIGDVPISRSKCFNIVNGQYDNGRVISADTLDTTITEVDFCYLRKFYNWTGIQVVGYMYVYERGYLPYPIVKSILDLYQKKTTLKGVEGKEAEYQHSKEMLNSCYGMMVTDIVQEENIYDNDTGWKHEFDTDITEAIDKYNKSKGRFLFYPWGVWVTAWSRRHLFEAIYSLDEDYIYADTDSVKLLNIEKHQKFFDDYNKRVELKLREAMKFHHLPFELCKPKTINGEEKLIGVFDFDGSLTRFKTLGAKRYIKEFWKDDKLKLEITISGVAKVSGIDYLLHEYKDNTGVLNAFKDGLEIPAEYTEEDEDHHEIIKEGAGKKLHIYIDEEKSGEVADYFGDRYRYDEKSAIYMSPTSYNMSMTSEYIDLLKNLKMKRRTI